MSDQDLKAAVSAARSAHAAMHPAHKQAMSASNVAAAAEKLGVSRTDLQKALDSAGASDDEQGSIISTVVFTVMASC